MHIEKKMVEIKLLRVKEEELELLLLYTIESILRFNSLGLTVFAHAFERCVYWGGGGGEW